MDDEQRLLERSRCEWIAVYAKYLALQAFQ
jgi:hypothetical protein